MNKPLKEYLSDWTDPDIAMYYLGCSIGMFPAPDPNLNGFREVKSILWSNNEIEETLEIIINRMVRNELFLFDDEEQKYKWNDDFKLPE